MCNTTTAAAVVLSTRLMMFFVSILTHCINVSDRTMAAGTVTITTMKKPTKTPRVHMYRKRLFSHNIFAERGALDTSLFFNMEDITMNFNEEHRMLIHSQSDSSIYRAWLNDDDDQPMSIDLQHEPGQLCYAITSLIPDVTLTIPANTSLALLLKTAQFHVTMYMLTKEQVIKLKRTLQPDQETIRDPRKRRRCDINNIYYCPCSPTTTPPPP